MNLGLFGTCTADEHARGAKSAAPDLVGQPGARASAHFSGTIGCASTREHFQSFGIYRADAPETIATLFGNRVSRRSPSQQHASVPMTDLLPRGNLLSAPGTLERFTF
jgi:hypothetical protein